jgi:hypothetical protein
LGNWIAEGEMERHKSSFVRSYHGLKEAVQLAINNSNEILDALAKRGFVGDYLSSSPLSAPTQELESDTPLTKTPTMIAPSGQPPISTSNNNVIASTSSPAPFSPTHFDHGMKNYVHLFEISPYLERTSLGSNRPFWKSPIATKGLLNFLNMFPDTFKVITRSRIVPPSPEKGIMVETVAYDKLVTLVEYLEQNKDGRRGVLTRDNPGMYFDKYAREGFHWEPGYTKLLPFRLKDCKLPDGYEIVYADNATTCKEFVRKHLVHRVDESGYVFSMIFIPMCLMVCATFALYQTRLIQSLDCQTQLCCGSRLRDNRTQIRPWTTLHHWTLFTSNRNPHCMPPSPLGPNDVT